MHQITVRMQSHPFTFRWRSDPTKLISDGGEAGFGSNDDWYLIFDGGWGFEHRNGETWELQREAAGTYTIQGGPFPRVVPQKPWLGSFQEMSPEVLGGGTLFEALQHAFVAKDGANSTWELDPAMLPAVQSTTFLGQPVEARRMEVEVTQVAGQWLPVHFTLQTTAGTITGDYTWGAPAFPNLPPQVAAQLEEEMDNYVLCENSYDTLKSPEQLLSYQQASLLRLGKRLGLHSTAEVMAGGVLPACVVADQAPGQDLLLIASGIQLGHPGRGRLQALAWRTNDGWHVATADPYDGEVDVLLWPTTTAPGSVPDLTLLGVHDGSAGGEELLHAHISGTHVTLERVRSR